jgi:nuclear pore complex protein Nup107
LYEHVRTGQLAEAIDACRQSDQSWRAASLSGGQLWSDPMLGTEEDGVEDDAMVGTGMVDRVLKGNANRRLWKMMCRKLAGSVSSFSNVSV